MIQEVLCSRQVLSLFCFEFPVLCFFNLSSKSISDLNSSISESKGYFSYLNSRNLFSEDFLTFSMCLDRVWSIFFSLFGLLSMNSLITCPGINNLFSFISLRYIFLTSFKSSVFVSYNFKRTLVSNMNRQLSFIDSISGIDVERGFLAFLYFLYRIKISVELSSIFLSDYLISKYSDTNTILQTITAGLIVYMSFLPAGGAPSLLQKQQTRWNKPTAYEWMLGPSDSLQTGKLLRSDIHEPERTGAKGQHLRSGQSLNWKVSPAFMA